jgi:hypothetical protein
MFLWEELQAQSRHAQDSGTLRAAIESSQEEGVGSQPIIFKGMFETWGIH